MADRALQMRWLMWALVIVLIAVLARSLGTVHAASPSYCAAYFHPDGDGLLLTLFPVTGPEVNVPLPPGMPRSSGVIFGPDGKAIYVALGYVGLTNPEPFRKVEFGPLRQSVVPGTDGFMSIWHFTVSKPSGDIFISGILPKRGGCGTFEVDPSTGAVKTLRVGAYPGCGGGGGVVSPDGTRILDYVNDGLQVVNLETGVAQAIHGIKRGQKEGNWGSAVTWSPNGQWVSAVLSDGKILLIDSSDMSRQRRLGPSHSGFVIWSPDSKYLLLQKSQLRCLSFDSSFDSLEILEVETGRRTIVKSSRCNVGPAGGVGWLDPTVVR